MFTGSVKAKLLAFVLVALLGTSYLGARYAGINFTGSGYDVSVRLPQAGGLYKNSQVTYRGVAIGEVTELKTTADGMKARLHIDGDAPKMSKNVSAQVRNRSAIGEQYVNLRADTSEGPRLAPGDVITGNDESLPPSIDTVLRTARDFTGSVPSDSLNTMIDELYDTSQGASKPLRQLVETSKKFGDSANKNFLVTEGLIHNSDTVLATQQESADSIKSFSRDLSLLADTLQDSDQDLRTLISNTPAGVREVGQLFDQVGPSLGILMSNLITPAQVFGTHAGGVEDALIRLPEAVSIGWFVNGSQGLDLGLAQTYFDPLPCTSGYGGTAMRAGVDTKTGKVSKESKPFNTKAGCSLNPSSGTNVRGPGSVPQGQGPSGAQVDSVDSLRGLLGGGK